MKRLTTFLLSLLLAAGVSHAQDTEVGLLAGGNFASLSGDTNTFGNQLVGLQGSSEFGRRFGMRIGGFLRLGISDQFAVRPELTYSQKGAAIDASGSTVVNGQPVTAQFDVTARYAYLDLPVLAEYTFPTSSQFKPYVFAGPSIGFSASSELETEITVQSGNQSATETQTEEPDNETTDFGAVIGGGLSYALESGNSILLDIRYNPSFTPLNSDSDIDLQNEAIHVGVGFSFSL